MNSSGNYDIMVAKYSPDGYLYWCNQYAGSGNGNDFATGLTIDGSGNVIITGSVLNSASDSNNVITIKYNSSGTQQWVSTYHGGTGSDAGTSLVADGSGNIYVCGTTNQGSSTKFDALLLKYNSSGTQQWARTYNYNSLQDGAFHVAMVSGGKIGFTAIVQNSSTNYKLAVVKYDASGNYVNSNVTGSNTIGFTMVYGCVVDNNRNIYVTGCTTGTSSVDYFTIKLDSLLAQQWTATYNGSSSLTDEAKGIVVDGSGNVYVTGYSITATQGKNIVTIKYNSSGSQQWTKTYDGAASKDDEGFAIAIDASGNPVVCGASDNGDSYDYYTVKYDASANIKWHMTWNSAANRSDRAMDVAVDQNGGVVVTGQSMTGATTYTYVTIKYSEHSVLTPTSSDPLLHAFCFSENRGQLLDTDENPIPDVKFYNRENAGKQQLYFTDHRLSYVTARFDTSSTSPVDTLERIDMTFDGASDDKTIYGMNERSDYMNYYYGQFTDPFARIKNYNTLFQDNVYQNIDVMYSNNSRGLKYYYIIAPGGNPNRIGEVYDGATNIYVDGNGDLVIEGALDTMRRPEPRVWEITSSGTTNTLAWQPTYTVNGTIVNYSFGSYNSANTLIIEVDFGNAPAIQQNPNDNLDWATHYGSAAGAHGQVVDVETDAGGNSYFSGYTTANNFPAVGGVFTNSGGNADGIILKFNSGAGLSWATYMGGSGSDMLYHIDVDTTGNVYFAGRSAGGVFLTTLSGGYNDASYNGGTYDWHMGKINTTGTIMSWSTYVGGSGVDQPADMKVTPTADRLYVVGFGGNSGWPYRTKTGAYNSGTGTEKIVEFDSALDTTWSANFGTGGVSIRAIDGDLNDGFFLTGWVDGTVGTVPYVDPVGNLDYFDNSPFGKDMFVARLNTTDTVTWCTSFGGSYVDEGWDIVKVAKEIVIVGSTSSTPANPFPLMGNVSAGEYKDSTINNNNPDGFIARFSVGGIQKWTTYFGGVGADKAYGVTADKSRTIYVTGETSSWDYDMQSYGSAYQQYPNLAAEEVFFASFSPTNALLWSTGFGGMQFEATGELATVGNEYLYFGGHSYSAAATFPWDYPTGGYIDTNKTNTAYGTPHVGRFGIQNINVGTPETVPNSFDFQLYPNPTDATSGILISGLYGDDIEIVITDMLGRVVYTRKIEGVFGTLYEQIDTSLWASGIYCVSIQTLNHGVVTKKLMKQ